MGFLCRLQDAAYARLQAMRRDKRARNGPFLENRRFSAQVRDLIRDGSAEEARAKCEKQVREHPGVSSFPQGAEHACHDSAEVAKVREAGASASDGPLLPPGWRACVQ